MKEIKILIVMKCFFICGMANFNEYAFLRWRPALYIHQILISFVTQILLILKLAKQESLDIRIVPKENSWF